MKFCFWQNIVSIHQAPFLEALAKQHEVVLLVEEKLIESRAKEGWNVPSITGVSVSGIPSGKELAAAFVDKEVHHVFSGINAFPGVYRAFKYAAKHRASISLFMEPYVWNDLKGFLRRCKYFLLYLRYGKAISKLFTTGRNGERCYRRSGFPRRKIYQWGYFTRNLYNHIPENKIHRLPHVIFVGSLDKNKNIIPLLHIMLTLSDYYERFTIIGRGPFENKVTELSGLSEKIVFIGTKSNEDVQKQMAEHDLLILPSLYDGWGAVVNEALMVGTRVLCSNRCGASVLIDRECRRGRLFSIEDMSNAIKSELQKTPLSTNQRRQIACWSRNHISGEIAARYFADSFKNSKEKPSTPWLEKS